jgi:hypothetical protein
MSQLMNGLVKELNEKIGDRAFFTLAELVSIGLFGTMQTARHALKLGELPFIRMSERRCVIPRAALLDYIRNNLSDVEENQKTN